MGGDGVKGKAWLRARGIICVLQKQFFFLVGGGGGGGGGGSRGTGLLL